MLVGVERNGVVPGVGVRPGLAGLPDVGVPVDGQLGLFGVLPEDEPVLA